MLRYYIALSDSTDILEREVSALMDEGWLLCGHPFIHKCMLSQAVVWPHRTGTVPNPYTIAKECHRAKRP